MSKRSDPAAFARAAGAADSVTLGRPASDDAPAPQPGADAASALAVSHELKYHVRVPYDPAEYRVVPVRRRPRYDGWTEEKQRRFIETLADTGLVNLAAKAVGMTRESAYRLRRSDDGAAFARAWDAARDHAGGLIEDIAFERAIEGTEHEMVDRYGDVIGTRLVHDNRLLKYLLSHLRPDRYGRVRSTVAAGAQAEEPAEAPRLADHLRAMEPCLPAPLEEMLDPHTLARELVIADLADGELPSFLREQRPPKSDERIAADQAAERMARGEAAIEKREAGGTLTDEEFADECYALDPASNARPRPRRRQ